jgi:hypothetical protein
MKSLLNNTALNLGLAATLLTATLMPTVAISGKCPKKVRWMGLFYLASLLLSSPALAAEETIKSSAPTNPSICSLSPHSKLKWSKAIKVINPGNEEITVIPDRDISKPNSWKEKELYFSLWHEDKVLLSRYRTHYDYRTDQVSSNWLNENLFKGENPEVFLAVGDQKYPLELRSAGVSCQYGKTTISRSAYDLALWFGPTAKTALAQAKASDIHLVLRSQSGNDTSEIKIPIGRKTISSWQGTFSK